MGLDMTVTHTRTGESREMSWLRNPYGLERWTSNNYTYAMEREPPEEQSLWFVLNTWNYDKAEQINKPLFLEVVKRYSKVIMQLEQAYFWFDEAGFKQFIKPHLLYAL